MIENHFLSAVDKKEVPLTPRQIEILQYRANGLMIAEIAEALGLEYQTVKNHVFVMMDRLNLPWERRCITTMVVYAWHLGLIL